MSYTSQAQLIVIVGVAGLKIGLHNRGNLSSDHTILESAIYTLPTLQYETGIKTRVENVG